MSFLKSVINYIQTTLNQNSLKKQAEINTYKQQEQQLYNTHAQLLLQDALFQVLGKVNISPKLCNLISVQDLLPSGFKLRYDTTVYYFMWTKTNTTAIPISMLNLYVQKMNTAIQSAQYRFQLFLQQLDYPTQAEYVQLYPVLYNGFVVRGCKDDGDAIILAVSAK